MTDRQKRLVRAALGLGVVTLMVAVGTWQLAGQRIAARCENWLATGRADLAAGAALPALDALGRALREPRCGASDDARTWFDYAAARVRVRAPDFAHVGEAIRALREARRLDPSDAEVGATLAEALLGVRMSDGAVGAAERVLSTGDHDQARRVLAAALLASGRTRQLEEHLENGWLSEGFWFRATRLLIADAQGPERATLVARLLEMESNETARRVLEALGGELDPDALAGALTGTGVAAGADVLGTAMLVLQQQARPELMLEVLAHHRLELTGALRSRLVALAWQTDRRDLVVAALDARPAPIHEVPELVVYGALAGHAPSLAAVRSSPDQDTEVARAWRALAVAVLDGGDPVAVADASAEALRDSPGSALALTLAAEAWLQLGELTRAEGLAMRAMAVEPFWAQPRLVRGVALAQRSREAAPDELVSDCEVPSLGVEAWRACARSRLPDEAADWQIDLFAIGKATRAGDLVAADAMLTGLRDSSPRRATLWRIARARTALATSRDEETSAAAALLLREVLDVLPKHAEARLLMGLARARLRDPVGGRADVLEAVGLEPKLWREALRLAVYMHREDSRADGAALIQLAGRIFAAAPLSAEGQRSTEQAWLQGLVVATAEGRDRALERAAYARLVQLDPDLDFALNNYAWLLFDAREALPTALSLAEQAVALAPQKGEYADTLASIRGWAAEVRDAEEAERSRAEATLAAERARVRAGEARRSALVSGGAG